MVWCLCGPSTTRHCRHLPAPECHLPPEGPGSKEASRSCLQRPSSLVPSASPASPQFTCDFLPSGIARPPPVSSSRTESSLPYSVGSPFDLSDLFFRHEPSFGNEKHPSTSTSSPTTTASKPPLRFRLWTEIDLNHIQLSFPYLSVLFSLLRHFHPPSDPPRQLATASAKSLAIPLPFLASFFSPGSQRTPRRFSFYPIRFS